MEQNKVKGITLIALVITIIVLLILAGVAISTLIGDNGILGKAVQAKEKTNEAGDLEYLQTEALGIMSEYYGSITDMQEDEYILTELGKKSGITANIAKGTVTYKNKEYTLSEITGGTEEKEQIEKNGLEEITLANAEKGSLEETLLKEQSVKAIIVEKEDKTNKAVIPTGFYYVTGTPSTGLVISDKMGDDDSNSQKGNQFVWIPCSGTNGITYEKTDDNGTGNHGLASYWKNKYSSKQWSYTTLPQTGETITDWSDNGGNYASVTKYGGFYIGRYEAGVPRDADFYADSEGATYYKDEKKNSDEVLSMSPIVQKGTQSWNYISQEKAKKVSENMYKNSTSVISALVDSYAWDTALEWITTNSQYSGIGMDSTNYGNYSNNVKITTNALHALHRLGVANETGKAAGKKDYWTYAVTYQKGNITTGRISLIQSIREKYEFALNSYDDTNYGYSLHKELATGASEVTKVKNIYDMSGNMWEWTTETGNRVTASTRFETTFAVIRGGCYVSSGFDNPISHRQGSDYITASYVSIGFRPVLYIKV